MGGDPRDYSGFSIEMQFWGQSLDGMHPGT